MMDIYVFQFLSNEHEVTVSETVEGLSCYRVAIEAK